MKKCIDCKRKGQEYGTRHQCVRKGEDEKEPRTGFKKNPPYCASERGEPWPLSWILGTCGWSGRFFEPKEKKKEGTRCESV